MMNNDVLMTPEMCMRFLVWSYYYHDIIPEPTVSYGALDKFAPADAGKLDDLRDTLFRCFEAESVRRACSQLGRAKQLGEPCPFSQTELDQLFAQEK